jgi:hypothetical protein
MSKLTNHQIMAQINSLEAALQRDGAAGMASTAAARRRRKRLGDYLLELSQREAAGADPRTAELQDSLHGEARRRV